MAEPLSSNTSNQGLHYISCGPASSDLGVIYIHGWGCRASDYTPLFQELSHQDLNFRTIAVDLPGCGKTSQDVCPTPTIPAYATLVNNLANELHFTDVFLVGHSMGCRLSLELWHQSTTSTTGYPNIKGIVFLDGSTYSLRPLASFESGNPLSKNLSDEEKTAKRAEMFQSMFSPCTPLDFQTSTVAHIKGLDVEHSGSIRAGFIQWDYDHMHNVLQSFGKSETQLMNLQSTDITPANRRVSLIAGQTSKWMEFLQQKVPRAEQHVIANSAHFPHIDHPGEVAEKLTRFINRTLQKTTGS